jgi:GTP-binding protein
VCDAKTPEALPRLSVDEPTMSMIFEVNKSPFAGKEGKFVTSRQISDRLQRELKTNVALRVEPGESPDQFRVSGRGLLHLGVLLENMRREGYDGQVCEPYETVVADVEEANQGGVIQGLAERGGKMQNMVPDGRGRVRLEYIVPSRGLIGFQTQFMTMTSGTGLIFHNFDHFGPKSEATDIGERRNGVMISNEQGKVLAYALFNLQERGRMMAEPGDEVYEGQIVGIHSRDNDLVVNVLKGKKLTNMRASGSDENVILTPAVKFALEPALEFINNDELVELTPESIRIRKKHLKEHERKRADRAD